MGPGVTDDEFREFLWGDFPDHTGVIGVEVIGEWVLILMGVGADSGVCAG